MNKLSDIFRKRALFGVAIFCIAAIATVGALSTGGEKEDNTPDSLVDLNATDNQEGNQQVADHNPEDETKAPDQQVADSDLEGDTQNPDQIADSEGDTQDPNQVADSDSEGAIQNPDQVADNQPEVQESENPIQTADNGDAGQPSVPDETEVLSPQLIAEQLNFDKSAGLLWPVEGSIVIPYSPDHGVFHQTLDQFSTSEAVVLSSAVGTEVRAAAKGVITSIEEDVRTGTTVTLALGNDTRLVYGQLSIADLKEGDIVEAGECLGTVAEPTKYYVVEGPNLYFQVLEGEESIDPTLLLGEE